MPRSSASSESVASSMPAYRALADGPAPSRDFADRIGAAVQRALDDRRLVGAVVVVARDGVVVHRQAAGLADRESGRAMTVDGVFRLASVSKPIVSTAALVLAAQGRLALDEDIARWLPSFQPRLPKGEVARITARQLLSHTAGFGYRFFEPVEAGGDANGGPYARAGVSDGMDASGISLEENLRRIAGVPLQYEPGKAWGYSLATDVLGALIERVHGSTLDSAIRDLVTGPLGMADTGFVIADRHRAVTPYVNGLPLAGKASSADETALDAAGPEPHRLGEGEVVASVANTAGIIFSPSRIFDPQAYPSGGAGMAGSAEDVLRLLEALRQDGGGLLPPALLKEMSRDHIPDFEIPDGPGWGFGLGFSVLRDRTLWPTPESVGTWRWGGAYGHSWFVDPAQRLSVVALTNTLYEGMQGQFVVDLRDAVYEGLKEGR